MTSDPHNNVVPMRKVTDPREVDTVLHDVIRQLLTIAASEDKNAPPLQEVKVAGMSIISRIFSFRVKPSRVRRTMSQPEAAKKALIMLEQFSPSGPNPRFILPENIKALMDQVLPMDGETKSLGRRLDTYRGVQALLRQDRDNKGKLTMRMLEGRIEPTAVHASQRQTHS